MERQVDEQTVEQIDMKTGKQTDKHMYNQRDEWTDKLYTIREMNRQTYLRTEKQILKQTRRLRCLFRETNIGR
jgi:hypothetical protein